MLISIVIMEKIRKIEESMLIFRKNNEASEDGVPRCVGDFENGKFMDVLISEECKEIFFETLHAAHLEPFEKLLEKAVQLHLEAKQWNPVELLHVLCVGASALCAWLQHAESGPPLPPSARRIPWLEAMWGSSEEGDEERTSLEKEAASVLARPAKGDVEEDSIPHPLALLLATTTLRRCAECQQLQTGRWWLSRALFAQQRTLMEASEELHSELSTLFSHPPLDVLSTSFSSWRALLMLEAARGHLWYGHLRPAKEALALAQDEAGLDLQLVGTMGKRTRYQQKELAQLTLQVRQLKTIEGLQSAASGEQILGKSLPKDVHLQDDVRLDHPLLTGMEDSSQSLTPVQQAVVLGCFSYAQRAQPHDELAVEQLEPYLQVVLARPQVWSLQGSALLLRSRMEGKKQRTAERAMCQMEELSSASQSAEPSPWLRLHCLLSVEGASRTQVRSELARALLSLGCVRSALDIFLELRLWEDAVACYAVLGLKHKAAELLRQQLEQRESIPLLCLLGDVTGETEHYTSAWHLSGKRSSRAQRHWAMHYFLRKQYAESIPHLQLSLQLNSLQPELWQRLGYAALDAQDWTLCASAYRRCVELDQENVEAWNNLCKAYVSSGQKMRAWAALQEALKVDFDDWRLWENAASVTVDAQVRDFSSALRALHRLLDLRPRTRLRNAQVAGVFSDDGLVVPLSVLEALVRAVADDVPDCDGGSASRLRPQLLKLFGRITSMVTGVAEVWQLYARVTSAACEQSPETLRCAAQHLQRAHRVATQRHGWARSEDSAARTLQLTRQLAEAYLSCAEVSPEPRKLLSSARLSIKGVVAAVYQEVEVASALKVDVQDLEQKLLEVEEAMKAKEEGT